MSDIQVGDVVYLKSGSPAMTVDACNNDSGWARTKWFLSGEVRHHEFELNSLTKENPNKKPSSPATSIDMKTAY